jgi:hypothetical protein
VYQISPQLDKKYGNYGWKLIVALKSSVLVAVLILTKPMHAWQHFVQNFCTEFHENPTSAVVTDNLSQTDNKVFI